MRAFASALTCLAIALASAQPARAQTMAPPSSPSTGSAGMSGTAPGGSDPSCNGEIDQQQPGAPCAGRTGPATGPTPRPPSVTPTVIPKSPGVTATPLPTQPGAAR